MMQKQWFSALVLSVFLGWGLSGCSTAPVEELAVLPYLPGNEYALYCFSDILPHRVTAGAPESLDGVRRKYVSLRNETLKIPGFFRQSRSRSAVLVSEFDSPARGIMTFGCGADRFLKIECNGKTVLDRWQEGTAPGPVSKYSHILTVPIRKGRNVLVYTVANGSDGWSFSTGSIPAAVQPSAENLERLNDFLPAPGSQQHRTDAFLMDLAVRQTRQDRFQSFAASPALEGEKLTAQYAQTPLLKVYDLALDRIMDELPAEKPAPGEFTVWNLCHSGMVVKTPGCTFGVDIRHRRAELLAPYLDALFLTRPDCGDLPLMRAMSHAGKPVFSTFYRGGRLLRSPASFRVKDLQVSTLAVPGTGHSAEPATVYRIVCGTGPDARVLLFTGKTICRAGLVQTAAPADLLVADAASGTQLPDAVHMLSPRLTLLSGLWEPGEKNSVSSTEAENICRVLKQEGARGGYLLWGEKIVFSGKVMPRKAPAASSLRFRNALQAPFSLTGFPWRKAGEPLSRLPLTLTEKELPGKVFESALHSAGGVIRFRTDSPEIALRASCSGESGCAFDLYEEITPGTDRFCKTLRSRITGDGKTFLRENIFRSGTKKMRSFAVYLPLSCRVKRLEIGLQPQSQLLPPRARSGKNPVVFCGGSAIQGLAASRPGNSFSTILCRALDVPQVNLGFSGAVHPSPVVAQLIAGLSPAAVVLEYNGSLPHDTQERFFKALRSARPELPILLLGECCGTETKSAAGLRRIYEDALARGDRRVRLIEGKELFSPYLPEDCCTDGGLPTDLGHRLMSRRILPVLRSFFLLR